MEQQKRLMGFDPLLSDSVGSSKAICVKDPLPLTKSNPMGVEGWSSRWSFLVANRALVALLIVKVDDNGDPALTNWFYGFDSRSVLGLGHTKYFKMVMVPACLALSME